ncbi:MAG: FHA domain-containing protein [Symploca sp. SIO1A3]|nr:FHA domain-containing protein [Symploca sp. SIO1A3]
MRRLLKYIDPDSIDSYIDITKPGTYTLGRSGTIRLRSRYASRIHALISVSPQDEKAVLIDGDGQVPSRNGTLINGRIISGRNILEGEKSSFLKPGDEIRIGREGFIYIEEDVIDTDEDKTVEVVYEWD